MKPMTPAQRERKNRNHREYLRRRRLQDPEFAAREAERARRFRQGRPGMTQAWARVSWAIEKGILVRPDSCEECGKEGRVQAAHEDYTRPLDVRFLCFSCHTIWDAAHPKTKNLEAANELALKRRADYQRQLWGREKMIEAAIAWSHAHGVAPSATDWTNAAEDHPCQSSCVHAFGSWTRFITVAGLPGRSRGRPVVWATKEQILEAAKGWAESHGRPPSAPLWMRGAEGRPCTGTVIRVFGSWSAFMDSCGFPPNRQELGQGLDLIDILDRRTRGQSYARIASDLGASTSTIWKMVRRDRLRSRTA